MNKNKLNHNLIEYVLEILSFPEYADLEIEQIIEKNDYSINDTLSNPQYIKIAREVIEFMDELPGGFLIYQAEGDEKIIYANKTLLRIFQCNTMKEFREWTKNSFKGFVYEEDLDEVEESIKEQIAQSQYDLDYVEYRIMRKDGELRWLDDYGHFIQSNSMGGIFYVFLGDATEKRQNHLNEKISLIEEKEKETKKFNKLIEQYDQERLLINQEYLRQLEVIEGLSINYESILYAKLDQNKILPYRLNYRTQQQFETKYQVKDYDWFFSDYLKTWVHPDDQAKFSNVTTIKYIKKKLSSSKNFYLNFRVLDKEQTLHIQIYFVNVSKTDRVSQVVIGFRRIDDEILHERQQRQLLSEALHNANLAIKAKNTFLSNVSHDMRTPLNAISGYSNLAENHIEDKDAVLNYLDKIDDSSRQLLDLIEKVLEFSWTEAQDIKLEESKCNLSDIIFDIQKSLNYNAEQKAINLTVNTSSVHHPEVIADEEKLRQILQNLVSNAITYTPNGGNVSICVSEFYKNTNNYATYQFEIKDTGIGISDEFLEHIYDPFERENNTTMSGVYGIGLGLAIVKRLLDMMNGQIKIDSVLGKGSTFLVTIKLYIAENTTDSSMNSETIMANLMQQKILLVDDNEINLEIEKEILQEYGFKIITAENGNEAVEKIKTSASGEFGLILMDVQMPVMNGLEATTAIRNLDNPILSAIPIIALSANAFESDRKRSIESGMNAHLTKPLDIPVLLDTIVKVISSIN